MLPIIQREVEKRGWASDEEVIDYYAIGQSTPVLSPNTATFIGFKKRGLWELFCYLGMISPSW